MDAVRYVALGVIGLRHLLTLLESGLIDPEIDKSDFQQWRDDSVRGAALDKVAQDVIDLNGRAFAQIAIHRGGQRSSLCCHRADASWTKRFRQLAAAGRSMRG